MLLKKNRLQHRKDFDNAFKSSKGVFAKIIGIKFVVNNLENSRFGIIISNKISKKAVIRNKIKRQIREIIRLNLDNIKKGFDIVIITRIGIVGKKYQEIEKNILEIFKKTKLLK
ncbi:MAG: ribonuclease P protein component [Xanthomonadaceae bacterium]|nr:ribonuclease P protein component [Rhodospirillaceae bacterium]NIA18084.1 ribonuclease P protein component [Xanthomonadaceae bacterium]